jgi:hypothetical protein
MNTVMQLAYDYLESTNTIVFLTGKAGTGKTTFLQKIRAESKKKLAVVAPTGVAAINAGGMTLHSLFQLPFGPLIPGGNARPDLHYSQEKKDLLSNLELLIIDEISMVRPDVLDQVDLILRNVKESAYPFGGVQLLLIGDLSQLSPIIREEEWTMLGGYYQTPYFFSSQVLQKAPYIRIELDHVFRQKDQDFVDILNEVRNQELSKPSLALLNARYQADFRPVAEDPYITLTTHNSLAQEINNERIETLTAEEYEFTAAVRGDFPKDAYPTDTSLKLKVGAQVMFVKNDGSAEKLFYNGKIGMVQRIEGDTVFVQCGTDREIAVQAMEWNNIKYRLEEGEISETNAGSFAQLPLKLAWAITIHKSQGLSFEKAIIDVSEAFTHGQAYVALSRCRSLPGMVLRKPISAANIIGDPAVSRFNQQTKLLSPDLERDQERYRLFLLSELFNFSGLKAKAAAGFGILIPGLQRDILDVAEKFSQQLTPARIEKACAYFYDKLKETVENLYLAIPGLIGDSKERAAKADQLLAWLMDRLSLMEHFSKKRFTAAAYVELKNNKTIPSVCYLEALSAKPHEKLFRELLNWREKTAEKERVMPNMIFSEKTLAAITEKLPSLLKTLSAIKGVGPQKTMHYGPELIILIRAYQDGLNGQSKQQASLF